MVFCLRKIAKCKRKKIPGNRCNFWKRSKINKVADEMQRVQLLSIDTKTTISIGPFSRNARCGTTSKFELRIFVPNYCNEMRCKNPFGKLILKQA